MRYINNTDNKYKIDEQGNILSMHTGEYLQHTIVNGYHRVQLYSKNTRVTKRVHRLVAETYIPNPDNLPDVDHNDEDRDNNSMTNLKWTTRKANTIKSVVEEGERYNTGQVPKSIIIDGIFFVSIYKAAKYIIEANPSKKLDTVRRELRRVLNGDRAYGKMYGHTTEKSTDPIT